MGEIVYSYVKLTGSYLLLCKRLHVYIIIHTTQKTLFGLTTPVLQLQL